VAEQCALAATAAAHNDHGLASMDVERNVVKHRAISESPDEIVYFDNGSVSGHDQNDE
jgi:hypothetical protein